MELDFSKNTIVLHPGQKLSEYNVDDLKFSEGLPHGVLHKRYTGIGATYCELNAPRHSIIVFPFRRLAKEKADKYNGLFVGTDFNNKSTTPYQIKKFLRSETVKFKKICVVADSISKVIDAIEDIGNNPYKDYFLVLDEVEILQMQSGFRNRLPLCFDFFKLFIKKCFVSATLLEFNDSEISNLPKFEVMVDNEIKPALNIIRYSKDPHVGVANRLSSFIGKSGNYREGDKFFIGLNSITGILEMLDVFEKAKIDDISVLLGEGSKERVNSKYTKRDIQNGKLPSMINIATCAYWNGIDIEEEFFPIAISLNTQFHHIFSFENLVQFFGRCRKKINYPATLVLPKVLGNSFEDDEIPAETRINDARSLVDSLQDIIQSKTDLKKIKDALCTVENGILYKGISGEPQVNYLFGDLEKYKNDSIQLLKNNGEGLIKRISSFFRLTEHPIDSRPNLFKPLSKEELYELDLPNFLSYLNKDYSSQKLIDRIHNHDSDKIRVAAYWYLFGRYFYDDEEKALELTKFYSEEVNYSGMIKITNSILEGLRFYIWQNEQFNELKYQIFEVRNQQKNLNSKGLIGPFKKFNEHFPSIFQEEETISIQKRNLTVFFKMFFNINPINPESENEKKFKVTDLDQLDPFILSISNNSGRMNFSKLSKSPRGKILNAENFELADIIDFVFE